MTDEAFRDELDAEYEIWLRKLTPSTMPTKARAALMVEGEVDWDQFDRELAVAFLAEQFEDAMAAGGYVSSPELQADGTVALLWHKPEPE